MLMNLSRPNFFPGQLIDYRDFNRLSEQADRTIALLCRHLYSGGGVISGALEEFRVAPLGDLKLAIRPGLAILPSGHPVVMSEERIADLTPYADGKTAKTVVLSIRNAVKGVDKYLDEVDGTITGYRTETFEPELLVSSRKPAEDALELLRVILPPGASRLRLARPEEQWREKLTSTEDAREAVLDLRHRARIIPHTHVPHSVSELIALRTALYEIENSHRKIGKLFLIEDPYHTENYLSQLHAELLNVPMQPLKVSFLLSELAKKMSLYLERLLSRLGRQHGNLDQNAVYRMMEKLERLRCRDVIPSEPALGGLVEISAMFTGLVELAEKNYSMLGAIEEALLEMRTRHFPFGDTISLGGHVLQRVDLVEVSDESRYQIKSESCHSRTLSTVFKNGDKLSLKGRFIDRGIVSVDIKVPDPDKPLVLLQNRYVRRGGAQVHYEINGKHLMSEQGSDLKLANNWMNWGMVIRAENLVSQENRLKIRVDQSDLDFGFFNVAAYQPVTDAAEGSRS